MPTHSTVGSTAEDLAELIEKIEKSGEKIITVLPAGNTWTVITEKKAPRKAQTR